MRGRISLLITALILFSACPAPLQRPSDPFAEFRAAVIKNFTPVATQFALGPAVEKKIYPELYIEFRGPAGRIVVSHELGSGPWVKVAVPTASGQERSFGLHTIVEHREGSRRSFDATTKAAGLDAQVRMLADLTSKHAGSLLKERTANLRELHVLSERALRERERRELGLNRSARVRPTLSQLFQACEPDLQDVCAYFAVVDYNYSTDAVAAFLEVKSDHLQRTFNAYDTIQPPHKIAHGVGRGTG